MPTNEPDPTPAEEYDELVLHESQAIMEHELRVSINDSSQRIHFKSWAGEISLVLLDLPGELIEVHPGDEFVIRVVQRKWKDYPA